MRNLTEVEDAYLLSPLLNLLVGKLLIPAYNCRLVIVGSLVSDLAFVCYLCYFFVEVLDAVMCIVRFGLGAVS